MTIASAIYAVGSTGIFPSRAFIPAFVTALLLRFGHKIPFLAATGLVPAADVKSWFTSNAALIVLGVLAVLECIATKNVDVRQSLDELDRYLKPAVAALVVLGVLSVADAKTINAIQQAGVGGSLLALLSAGGVYVVGGWRRTLYDFLTDIDADDSLGLQRIVGWFEDAWVVFAVVLLVVYPLVMTLLIGVVLFVLSRIRKHLIKREAGKMIPCAKCATPVFPCAMACQSCGTPLERPCSVGFFGQTKPGERATLETHPFRLVEKRRCPVCAGHLLKRTPWQACPACGRQLMADPGFMDRYDAFIQGRGYRVLLISFLFSLLPVIGVIPGVIYYRSAWVAPYRRYVSAGRSLLTRLLVRLLSFVLLAFQWVPFLGAISLPLMALLNHWAFRRALRRLLRQPQPV